MNSPRFFLLSGIVALCLLEQTACAQLPPGTVPGLTAAMTKLFGNNNAFTATATARLFDEKNAETTVMPMTYAVLDGKIRSEIDMTRLISKDLDNAASAGLKQIGIDRMISIVRPEKNAVLVIYPSLRAYTEMPINQSQPAGTNQQFKIESTKLGQEIVAGHRCQKNKVVVSNDRGDRHEAIVWNAADLKDFPIKMQMAQPGGVTMVMSYTNVKFERPDLNQFEAPAGFEKYQTLDKLLESAMMKLLSPKSPTGAPSAP